MDKKKFKRYAQLKIKERDIKAELSDLAPVIRKEMQKAKSENVPSDFGTFMLKPVKVYSYSEEVIEMEAELEVQKMYEKKEGIADVKTRTDLVFIEKRR